MGYYVNETGGPLRVDDGQGRLRRVAPGAVVEAKGEFEEGLKDLDNVRSVSAEEAKELKNGGSTLLDPSRDASRDQAVTNVRAAARMVTVSVPLNEVVGDDDAPYGP